MTPRPALRRLYGRVHRQLYGFYAVAGLLLSAGLLVALVSLWALSGFTENVLEGETLRFDERALLWMSRLSTPWLDGVALDVTALGAGVVVATIALTAGTLLWLMGRRRYAVLLGAAVGGAGILSLVLKQLFGRPRPALFESPVPYVGSSAYPSGHAIMGTVLWLVMAYTVYRLAEGRRGPTATAVFVGGTLVLLIGVSRVYLGVHYPTDVLAGYVVGFAWAVFCAIAVETYPYGPRRRPGGPHDPADAT